MSRKRLIPTLGCVFLGFVLTATTANARCPTLTGFAAFKRCYLAADSAMERNNLQNMYEAMLAEDLARARMRQNRSRTDGLGPVGSLSRHVAPQSPQVQHAQTPHSNQTIQAEIEYRNRLRQQRNSDIGRARNQFRVDQGRARSQDLLSGTSKR